jgi:hypothetical protein
MVIKVSNISIGPYGCSDHYFKILNCNTLIIEPNNQIWLEVAFQSDLLLTRIETKIYLFTDYDTIELDLIVDFKSKFDISNYNYDDIRTFGFLKTSIYYIITFLLILTFGI